MERLETIVDQMESGSLPLETMLERYEEGTRMVKICSQKLAAAEKRIEIIGRTPAGETKIAPFDPDAPAAAPPQVNPSKTIPPPADDEIRLF